MNAPDAPPITYSFRFNPKDEQEHTFDELSALVRLSHKYRIQDVEEQALDFLREQYTDNFDKWHVRFGRSVARPTSIPHTECIGVVNIARLTNTPSLLPAALYSCCMLGAVLLDGWKREDGCVEYLSSDDLKRCFAARERLCKEGADIMGKIVDIRASAGCSDAVECRAGLNDIVVSIVRGKLSSVIGCAALAHWADVIHTKALFRDICATCKTELLFRDVKARRRLWNKLPEIFGITIAGWGESTIGSE